MNEYTSKFEYFSDSLNEIILLRIRIILFFFELFKTYYLYFLIIGEL